MTEEAEFIAAISVGTGDPRNLKLRFEKVGANESSRLGCSRSGRILAPLAFIPVHLLVQTGRRMGLELSCSERGADRVVPNQALFAWIERQSGKRVEIDDDPSAPTS